MPDNSCSDSNDDSMETVLEEPCFILPPQQQQESATSTPKVMAKNNKSGVDNSKHSELTPATHSMTEQSSPFSTTSITSAMDDFDAMVTGGTPTAVASSSSSFLYSSHSASPSLSLLRMTIPRAARPSIDPRYARRLPEPPPVVLTPPPTVYRSIFRNATIATTASTTASTPRTTATSSTSLVVVPTMTQRHRQYSTASTTSTTTTTTSASSPLRKSPASKRAKAGDRYIPSRPYEPSLDTGLWEAIAKQRSDVVVESTDEQPTMDQDVAVDRSNVFSSILHRNTLTSLLQSEVLGRNENQLPRLRFSSSINASVMTDSTSIVNSFGLSPVSPASQRLIAVPSKRKRKIPKVPFKVLDAPALQDDFYLNLVDWSSQNVLAVGLGACVYLWSACTSKVTKLCDLTPDEDTVTAVSWAQRGIHLSVGTNKGEVQLWDTIRCKKIRSMGGHTARVGTLAWTGPLLASGSRDRLIYLRDVRVQDHFTHKLSNHRQEVCGLRWSFEEPAFLASGGNDNNLHVVDSRNPTEPLHKFTDHTAAVKAIAWSPHQHGLLASGGGTADRCIRFWNTLSGASLNKIDTGSQVCNLAWSQNCNEIVSTHGYSLNQVVVWRYPSMSKVTTLTGHTYRVLYLAMSPDGSTVVTGAGDETLRFWQVFPGPRSDTKSGSNSLLFPQTVGSVIR